MVYLYGYEQSSRDRVRDRDRLRDGDRDIVVWCG